MGTMKLSLTTNAPQQHKALLQIKVLEPAASYTGETYTRLKWIELMGKIIYKGQVRCTMIIYERVAAKMKTMEN